MALKISTAKTFTWPVKFTIPGNNGEFLQQQFTGEFRRMNGKELDALMKRDDINDRALAAELLVGWADVEADDDGTTLAVTPENKEILLDVMGVDAAIIRTFFEAHKEAALKN